MKAYIQRSYILYALSIGIHMLSCTTSSHREQMYLSPIKPWVSQAMRSHRSIGERLLYTLTAHPNGYHSSCFMHNSGYRTKWYIHGSSRDKEECRLHNQAKGAEQFLWHHVNFKRLLNKNVNKPFLEVGCGVGAQTLHLLERLPIGFKVVAVDIDPQQITRAQKFISQSDKFKSNICFEVLDIKTAAWERDTFGGAYIAWVLEHIGNKEAEDLLSKLRQAVQDGGVIIANEIIMEPKVGMHVVDQRGNFPPMTERFLNAMIAYQISLGGNPNYGKEENMRQVFSNAGFNDFQYHHITMDYPKEELTRSKMAAIEMFDGIIGPLIVHNFFLEKDYSQVVDEINDACDLSWSFGQIIARQTR